MILDAFRWICGYISFKVTGGFPEKFLNNIVKKEINLWDLKKINGSLYAKILSPEYKFINSEADKSGSKVEIIKKFGWPVFLFKYKKRLGILVGIFTFIFIIHLFSLRVWNINVSGNENISSSEIISVMKDLGVSTGTKKSKINSSIIKQLVMSKINDISWISINIKGSCLNVCIKEKIKSPEIVKEGEACNIVAKSEGQIDHLEVYKGNPSVNEGDAVIKGQILISGISNDSSGGTSLIEADGKVFAKTKRIVTEKVKLSQLNAIDSGKITKKYKIKACDKDFDITPWRKIDETCRIEEYNQKLNIFGIEFPIIFHTDICYYQECEEKTLSLEQAKEFLDSIISEKEKNEFSDMKIISKNVDNYEEGNEYFSRVTYTCIENIAKKQKIS